jgi:hypothetical protein
LPVGLAIAANFLRRTRGRAATQTAKIPATKGKKMKHCYHCGKELNQPNRENLREGTFVIQRPICTPCMNREIDEDLFHYRASAAPYHYKGR